jgi:hypothetical protein
VAEHLEAQLEHLMARRQYLDTSDRRFSGITPSPAGNVEWRCVNPRFHTY